MPQLEPLIFRISHQPRTHRSVSKSLKTTGKVHKDQLTKCQWHMTSLTLSLLPCLSSPNSSSMTCLEPTNPCSSSTTSVLEMLEGTRRTGTMKWKRTLLLEGNKEPPQGCQMGPGRGRNKMIWSSHGLSCDTCLTSDLRVAPGRLSSFSWSLHEISNLLSHQSSTHHSLSLSPTHSGRTSSLGWWLTSITSSWVALLSPMTTMRSSQSVEWNSNSESPSPSNRLRCPETGLLHGESTLEQLHTCSHIGKRNLMHKGPEPYPYSLLLCPFPTLPLSTLTNWWVPQPPPHRPKCFWRPQALLAHPDWHQRLSIGGSISSQARNLATVITNCAISRMQENVPSVCLNAGTSMSAQLWERPPHGQLQVKVRECLSLILSVPDIPMASCGMKKTTHSALLHSGQLLLIWSPWSWQMRMITYPLLRKSTCIHSFSKSPLQSRWFLATCAHKAHRLPNHIGQFTPPNQVPRWVGLLRRTDQQRSCCRVVLWRLWAQPSTGNVLLTHPYGPQTRDEHPTSHQWPIWWGIFAELHDQSWQHCQNIYGWHCILRGLTVCLLQRAW